MTWPFSAALVIVLTALLWWALAWLGDYLERRPERVSDAALRGYQADELRQGWDRQVPWPRQRKGASGFWDRKAAKLRDVSRRQA